VSTLRLSADWVVTMDGAPIRGGAVVIGGDGKILSIDDPAGGEAPRAGTESVSPAAIGAPIRRQTVLLPGFVNAHSHLELTGLGGQIMEEEFPAWIAHLTRLWRERKPAEYLEAARQGVRDCWAIGITTVADCGATGSVLQALNELGGSGIAYHEIFGPAPEQADAALEAWALRLSELRRFETPRVRLGASPHAPYTVSGPLYRLAAAHARKEKLPIAVHVAESPLEDDFVRNAGGGFAESQRTRGLRPEARGLSPVAWLDQQGVFGADCLAVHCCTVDGDDIETLARRGAAVAHCPRSNRRHHRIDAPLLQFIGAGLRVGVGTDSVASVHPLDLLAEARRARELGTLDAQEALALVTLGAARTIGLGAEVGSLSEGKWGDLVALQLPPCDTAEQLFESVLMSTAADVAVTWIGGREVYRKPA
jgi:cytosine/adenosine deaminase-related metal-dependent hydrolase